MGTKFLIKPFSFQAMAKPAGALCNLNCTYCYYLEKQKFYQGGKSMRMTDKILETFISQYISAQEVPLVSFVWQGGEPALLGIEYYKKALDLQNKYAKGKTIENVFQTNGTLIDEKWARFFKENNFLVGVSIDGPAEIHNHYRQYRDNQASFDQVMMAIDILHKHKVDFNTLTVVNRMNSKFPLKIYQFLKAIGSKFIQFIPVVERKSIIQPEMGLARPVEKHSIVTDFTVLPIDYSNFLIDIFKEWVRNDVGLYFVQQFDATLANWIGVNSGICTLSETCGDAVVVEHNGDVYSCDHFVYPEFKLGNITENTLASLLRSDKQKEFGNNKLNCLPKECIECEYRFACHGECPKNRFAMTMNGNSGLNYLCSAYKTFYKYVHPFMQFMGDEIAAKRSPANVMPWARTIIK